MFAGKNCLVRRVRTVFWFVLFNSKKIEREYKSFTVPKYQKLLNAKESIFIKLMHNFRPLFSEKKRKERRRNFMIKNKIRSSFNNNNNKKFPVISLNVTKQKIIFLSISNTHTQTECDSFFTHAISS